MIEVIETNISFTCPRKESEDCYIKIMDHQSRVIEADSWEQYVLHYYSPDGSFFRHKFPQTFPRQCTIAQLKWDEYHLSCIVDNGRFLTYRLAYKKGECI